MRSLSTLMRPMIRYTPTRRDDFHGYYDCYCYLPLYIFCGRHLLAAKLRRARVDAAAGAVGEVARIVGQIRTTIGIEIELALLDPVLSPRALAAPNPGFPQLTYSF
jgi:hypothetical protein